MEPNGEKTRVLVIDDDLDVRFILKVSLKKVGYEVQAVEGGLKGLEAMRGKRFHLAIGNLLMPEMGERKPLGRFAR